MKKCGDTNTIRLTMGSLRLEGMGTDTREIAALVPNRLAQVVIQLVNRYL
jgi:hypothetical protein